MIYYTTWTANVAVSLIGDRATTIWEAWTSKISWVGYGETIPEAIINYRFKHGEIKK
jgi:hypothetical protein